MRMSSRPIDRAPEERRSVAAMSLAHAGRRAAPLSPLRRHRPRSTPWVSSAASCPRLDSGAPAGRPRPRRCGRRAARALFELMHDAAVEARPPAVVVDAVVDHGIDRQANRATRAAIGSVVSTTRRSRLGMRRGASARETARLSSVALEPAFPGALESRPHHRREHVEIRRQSRAAVASAGHRPQCRAGADLREVAARERGWRMPMVFTQVDRMAIEQRAHEMLAARRMPPPVVGAIRSTASRAREIPATDSADSTEVTSRYLSAQSVECVVRLSSHADPLSRASIAVPAEQGREDTLLSPSAASERSHDVHLVSFVENDDDERRPAARNVPQRRAATVAARWSAAAGGGSRGGIRLALGRVPGKPGHEARRPARDDEHRLRCRVGLVVGARGASDRGARPAAHRRLRRRRFREVARVCRARRRTARMDLRERIETAGPPRGARCCGSRLCAARIGCEAALLRRHLPAAPLRVVPNGVDSDFFRPSRAHPPPIAPHGSSSSARSTTGPTAMLYRSSCATMLPQLRQRLPAIEFTAVGHRPSAALRRAAEQPGAHIAGSVPDVRPYLADATICVVPLRFGRGVKNKVLEAMAMGLPVVASRVAVDGLAVRDREHLLIADAAVDIAAAIGALASDRERRLSLATNALRYVREWHRWDHVLRGLDEALTCSTRRSGRRRTAQALRQRQRQVLPDALQSTQVGVAARTLGSGVGAERVDAIAQRLGVEAPQALELIRAGADLAAPEIEHARAALARVAHELPVEEVVHRVAKEIAAAADVVGTGGAAEQQHQCRGGRNAVAAHGQHGDVARKALQQGAKEARRKHRRAEAARRARVQIVKDRQVGVRGVRASARCARRGGSCSGACAAGPRARPHRRSATARRKRL